MIACFLCRSIASRLQSMSHDFRGMQKSYLDQLKKFKGGGSFSSLIGEPVSSGAIEEKEEDAVSLRCHLPLLFFPSTIYM